MERQSDRAEVRRIYGELFDQVSAALFQADLIGINFGTNTDEYEPEASTILPRLQKCQSVRDVHAVLREEFVAWFKLDADDPRAGFETFAKLAEEVWGLWQRHLSAKGSG